MKSGFALSAIGCIVLALGVPSAGATSGYLDDRSSAEALVRSLYNAINRQEYARAYAYFETPPARTLDAYAAGYEDTESVEVLTGTARADPGAGNLYYSIPVAIRAQQKNGEERVFAGCYDLHLANPTIQTTPYAPLQIKQGHLSPADGPLRDVLPASCGEGTPVDQGDPMLEQAKQLFTATYSDSCRPEKAPDGEEPVETHLIRYKARFGDEEREAQLFRFFCDLGAYNESHVYFLTDDAGTLLPLHFAAPEIDIHYENGDPNGRVEEMRVIGYKTIDMLVNSSFDPQTLEITSFAKWRGIGDASESGVWLFRTGVFSLVRYEVDASYDDEINPEVLVDYYSTP